MNRIVRTAILTSLGVAASTGAMAHAFLTTASPKVGSTIAASPSTITLNFTEGLEGAFSTVEVDGPNGAEVAIGKPRVSGAQMVVSVTHPLAAGVYKVVWHATAVDTHKTQGDFQFTIKP